MTNPKDMQPSYNPSIPPEPGQVLDIWARTQAYLQAEQTRDDAFGAGDVGSGLYDRDLAGRPFVIVAAPVFTTSTSGNFGEQSVVKLTIQFVSLIDGSFGPVEVATISGRYIYNRIARMSERELVYNRVWTLARNPAWPANQTTGKYPLGLRTYNPATDRPEIVDNDETPPYAGRGDGGEFPTETATAGTPDARDARRAMGGGYRSVAERMRAIQDAGGPVDPSRAWDNGLDSMPGTPPMSPMPPTPPETPRTKRGGTR